MAKGYLDKLDLEQDNSGLSYEGIGTPVNYVRPKAGLLKQILGQSKESEKFSPYKKNEPVKATKIARKTAQPAPMAVEPVSPIQEDLLAPIAPIETRVSKKPESVGVTPQYDLTNSEYQPITAEEVSKKQREMTLEGEGIIRKAIKRAGDIAYSGERKPSYPRDVWENETKQYLENGDYEVYKDAGGGLSIRAKAPTFLEAIWLGQKSESQRLKDAWAYYTTDEDKKSDLLEYRRIQNQLEVPQEETATSQAGRTIGQVGGQVLTTSGAMMIPGVGLIGGSALAALPQAIAQGLDSEEEAFNISRNNGIEQGGAYEVAKQGRNTYLATGFAEGFVGALVNSRIAKAASALGPVTSKTFLSAAKKMVRPGLEIGSDALLAAGMSVIRDAKMSEDTGTDIDIKDRAIQNAELEAAVGLAFATLGYGYGKAKPYFPKWMKSQSLNMISELDRGFVEETLKTQQQEGVVDEEASKKILEDLDRWEETKKANIDVRPEAIPTVNGLQQKIESLNQDMKNATESSKPAIQNEIDLINQQIEKAKTSEDPLSAEIDDVTKQPIIKTEENATTISEGQEGPTTSGVSQYQGVEGIQDQATNEADNRNRPVSSETQQEVTRPEIFSTQEQKNVFEKMRDAAEKQYAKNPEDIRGATQKAIKTLKNSQFYKNLEGNSREAYIIEATKYFAGGLETTPSVAKAIGKINKKITVNEMTALKRLMRFGEQSSKGAVDYVNNVRKQIAIGLNKLEARGVIKNAQLQSILNKSNKLNLLSTDKVNNFVTYVSKVISDATFDSKLNQAKEFRTVIKKASKIQNRLPNLVKVANRFSVLNPLQVENIEEYNKVAESVYGGLRGTMVSMKSARYNQAFSESEVNDYIDKQVQFIENNRKQEILDEYNYLVESNVLSGEMTLQEIEQMVNDIEGGREVEDIEDKARYVKAYTNERFKTLSAFAKDIIEGGQDGLGFETDRPISKSDKEIMSTIIKNGIDWLPISDAYRVVESLDNFIVNGSHFGLVDIIKRYEGNMAYKSMNYKSRPLALFFGKSNTAGRIWAENVQNMNMTLFSMFRTVDRTVDFMKKSGILDMETNKTKAKTKAKKYLDEYAIKFNGAKANGLDINDIYNAIEQDMYAKLKRNQGGTDIDIQNEFNDQKILIEQSIQNLEQSTSDTQLRMAQEYRSVFDKIAKDSYNIADVESKVDKNNISVVNYWINAFSEVYPDLKRVAKDVYRENLGEDINYTPIKWKTVDEKLKDAELELDKYDPFKNSSFTFNYDQYIPKKKSGTLFKRKNLKNAPKGKYMQMNFVYNMSKSMESALVDVYTAGDIRKVKSFLDSDGATKVINKDDLNLLKEKVALYVKKSRNMEAPDYDDLSKFFKQLSRVNRYIVSSSLTSIKQFPAQTLPMILKTMINSGSFDFRTAGSIAAATYFNKDSEVNKFLDDIGYGISTRGLESTGNIKALESAMADFDKGLVEKGLQKLDKHNEKWLKLMLVNGDKIVARATWVTYYKKYLKANGVDVNNIDWDTHKLDEDAAAKAEMEVNLQQNVSDADLQSKLMGSNKAIISTIRNGIMPLSGFVMNSKAKLYVDIGVLTDKASTKQDRLRAARSFLATTLELSVYSSITGMSIHAMYRLAKMVFEGYSSEKEDETLSKTVLESIATNASTDLLSPAPPFNDLTASAINAVLDKLDPNTPKDLQFRLFDNGVGEKPWYQKVGLQGIGIKKIVDASKTAKASITGEVSTEYQGQESVKTLSPEEKEVLQIANVANFLYLTRLVPLNELANFANRVYKMAEKRALTEKQQLTKDAIEIVSREDIGSKEINKEGRTISQALARASNFKDPESRAKYIIEQSEMFEDKEAFSKGLDILGEANILDNATIANINAIKSGDDSLIKMAKIFSYAKQDARVAKLLALRSNMGMEQFYTSLAEMYQYGILSNAGVLLFAEKIYELDDYTDQEGDVLLSIIEE